MFYSGQFSPYLSLSLSLFPTKAPRHKRRRNITIYGTHNAPKMEKWKQSKFLINLLISLSYTPFLVSSHVPEDVVTLSGFSNAFSQKKNERILSWKGERKSFTLFIQIPNEFSAWMHRVTTSLCMYTFLVE